MEGPFKGAGEGKKIKISSGNKVKGLCMEQSSNSGGSSDPAASSSSKESSRFASGSDVLARSVNNPNYRN